ncbi:multicopper oxidase domain-containing protein [Knoellia sp. S7-12]|uniref:multicopper oxidase family protein n=1 Tax=Knoellia sp. S7-12 TaxID=3126698 RepID=UPI0033676C4A
MSEFSPEEQSGLMSGAQSVRRRTLLRLGAASGLGAALVAARGVGAPLLSAKGLLSLDGAFAETSTVLGDLLFYVEKYPTSPLILSPFTDPLPIPRALAPVPRSTYSSWAKPPGPGVGQQNSFENEQHQVWPSKIRYPDPIVYKIDLLLRSHSFTSSQVLPIDPEGQPTTSFDVFGATYPAGTRRWLPPSTIYGFNGTFPGPCINAEYGKPVLVRFENHLDENPMDLDRQDFGSPDWSFLTHLHNGHTAPESDGNPHYSMRYGPKQRGYGPGTFCDNLYLNWPAGGDEREKQSFFWFHDHLMDHTGSNVYKGMVGLYPIYDPRSGLDMGDETKGLRLPGVRRNRPDGSFDVDYDIPLAFYDCRLDDGVTTHQDVHDGMGEFPAAKNPATHPEWWGKSFYKHFPNHGFVGDIFTVNGTAYPTLLVKRRKYRFRFLDASVARIYEFMLMASTKGPKSSASLGHIEEELEGQYRIPDGQQCMKFTQIASDGGLLPFALTRDSFELWPAKRREVIIDFTRYQDGTPTTKGDVVYLTNVMKMPDGRMWSNSSRFLPDPNYKVPVLKFVIGDTAPDQSVTPKPGQLLRALPPLPGDWKSMLDNRLIFEVKRSSSSADVEWLINGEPFDPARVATSLRNKAGRSLPASQKKGSFNLWEIRNGGGGWVHPFHLHMEEHRTVMRRGRDVTRGDPSHPDDSSREDLVALDPGESVIVYRGFRDFVGPYVAHCHNLAHEDHAMMFGWEITP